MGSITDIFGTFVDTIFSVLDSASAAGENVLGAGSSAVDEFQGIVQGSLGDIAE